jgi:hypothetical protein
MITVHVITYNEEITIEFFINHYRERFPNCEINIYDNYSTDKTVEIGKKYNCNIIMYDTNNELNDEKYLEIKNNIWKNSNTDWVVICDCDELIEITENELLLEESQLTNIIKPIGYSLMNNNNELIELKNMVYGFRDIGFDKCILFNKKHIKEINYSVGAHSCHPLTYDNNIKYNTNLYRLLHYKYLSPTYTVNRHKMFGDRLSNINKTRAWGIHYTFSSESIVKYYEDKEKELIKLL